MNKHYNPIASAFVFVLLVMFSIIYMAHPSVREFLTPEACHNFTNTIMNTIVCMITVGVELFIMFLWILLVVYLGDDGTVGLG